MLQAIDIINTEIHSIESKLKVNRTLLDQIGKRWWGMGVYSNTYINLLNIQIDLLQSQLTLESLLNKLVEEI